MTALPLPPLRCVLLAPTTTAHLLPPCWRRVTTAGSVERSTSRSAEAACLTLRRRCVCLQHLRLTRLLVRGVCLLPTSPQPCGPPSPACPRLRRWLPLSPRCSSGRSRVAITAHGGPPTRGMHRWLTRACRLRSLPRRERSSRTLCSAGVRLAPWLLSAASEIQLSSPRLQLRRVRPCKTSLGQTCRAAGIAFRRCNGCPAWQLGAAICCLLRRCAPSAWRSTLWCAPRLKQAHRALLKLSSTPLWCTLITRLPSSPAAPMNALQSASDSPSRR